MSILLHEYFKTQKKEELTLSPPPKGATLAVSKRGKLITFGNQADSYPPTTC